MLHATIRTTVLLFLALATATASAEDAQTMTAEKLATFSDYGEAFRAAKDSRRMLAIYFHPPGDEASAEWFQTQLLTDETVRAKLANHIVAILSTSVTGVVNGETIRLLDHAGFGEMHGLPGVAIIDLAHVGTAHYGHVVSVFPFKAGRRLSEWYLAEMLSLPPGSLTQRTLIFAVRVHPERPASVEGQFHQVLAAESESHSRRQASIGVQGHHDWDYRFQRINGRLAGLTAQEVCAESWPGQDLVDAAFECVDSWRQSPGHWSALRTRSRFFGFDMKRGRNGIWYGTGIFARR